MNKICKQCNRNFSKKKTTCNKSWLIAEFCSNKCKNRQLKEKNYTRVNKVCIVCNKEFTVEKYREDKAKYCSKECSHKGRDFGLTTQNYKIRRGVESRLWREAVFARDNWTCQKYGLQGGKLSAHHINNFSEFPELRFAIDNGITLSEKAHKEFHRKYGFRKNNKGQMEEFINSVSVEA